MGLNPLKQIYTDFIKLVKGSVIKYKSEADKYETLEIKKSADAYVNAMLGLDTFYTYYKYDKEIISEVMNISDEETLSMYYSNREKIDIKYRDSILKRQRAQIISNYVEKNEYYRCLMGLPGYNEKEKDYIYVDKDICATYGINPNTPIHELVDAEISALELVGYMDKLYVKYPTKKYLRFLGANSIDLVTARTAKNFGILRIPYEISEAMWNSFSLIYEQCREYFMTCIYVSEFKNTIDYYDNFIALCIMIMSIQQILARTAKAAIERDFFDNYCVQLLFDIYNVPYYEMMDSSIRKLLIQNLNLLVLNKGTNKVIFDISSILGYDRLKVFKYYIVKNQNFDYRGVPVVYYTTDETTGEKVIDYKRTYDVYFQKVEIGNTDTYKSMLLSNNRVSYKEITNNDPFWFEDEELQKELYESEYNYIESKYLGVNISFKLTRLLFENVLLLRMLFDKKDEIPGIVLEISKILQYEEVSLFDAVVILCALTSRMHHLKGEILTRPSMILHVMGFNFEKDFAVIREEILTNEYIDDSLADFFTDSRTYTAESVNALYRNYISFYSELVNRMATTESMEAYQAYKKLYDTVFYTSENQNMFNIGTAENPVYASTFMEYIKATHLEVYNFINQIEDSKVYEYINHVCLQIQKLIPGLQYLGFSTSTSSSMEFMLVELVKFFKSYTTDMLGFDVIYVYDLKPENMIRLIDKALIHKTNMAFDNLHLSYSDNVNFTSNVTYSTEMKLRDDIFRTHVFHSLYTKLNFKEVIQNINKLIVSNDNIGFMDIMNYMYSTIDTEESIKFEDFCRIISKYFIKDEGLHFRETYKIEYV